MSEKTAIKTRAVALDNRMDPYLQGAPRVESKHFWRWGEDNLLPVALALMARRSTTHRRIINDKADYIAGKGFVCDEQEVLLAEFLHRANGEGETLRSI
ncbi:MAG: phage portal protein, partial [Alistipes sp.]|nr:phage portal protein [Alistipes sp.]